MITMTNEVRRGGLNDIPALMPLLERAQHKMGPPYLRLGPNLQAAWLRSELDRPETVLLIAGDPPYGFCWAEVLGTRELLIHEVCMAPGKTLDLIIEAIRDAARKHGCTRMTCLTYRPGAARLFRRYGFVWTANLLQSVVQPGGEVS